jgi:proline dehydrogenase
MLRSFFRFLSQQKTLRRWMEHSTLAKPLTRRFISGNTLEEALAVCRKLNAEGIQTSLDYLGESVTAIEEANLSRDRCRNSIEQIHQQGIQSTISVKLTQLGLDIEESLCFENARQLAAAAQEAGTRVEFDMESTPYVDRTLCIVERLHQEFGCVRAVLQAYLFRTEADVERLNAIALPVRICKGAYSEPETVSFEDKAQVDLNYLKLSRMLLEHGKDPAIATHDDRMVAGALSFPKDSFEFQMLYGVRRELQRKLASQGYRVRVYVPYGEAWYPYFMRRLAERPANVLFIVRNFFRN